MRFARFLIPALSMLTTTFVVNAAHAGIQPHGVCTPPGAWAMRADVPSPEVRSWGAFFPPNGMFYLLGGRASGDAGSDFLQPFEYDPSLDTWTTKAATFADSQVNNMVGGVLDFGGTPYIVVVGGSAAGATTATSEVRTYDPIADQLTTLDQDPWPGNASGTILPGGAAVLDNKLYVFGGFDINVGMIDTIYRFDPAQAAGSRWTTMTATLPVPLGYIPVAASGSLIYITGGSGYDGTTITDNSDSFSYDPVADTIAPISPIPRPTGETRAITQLDGSVWVLGGGRVDPNPSNEVDVYTPATDTWSLGPPFSTVRRNFGADVDPATGDIWAAGGYDVDGLTSLSINEQFTPCTIQDDTIFADGFDGS